MNREQKIEAIYNKIADKTLSFGCKVFIQNYITPLVIVGDNRGICITETTQYEEFLGQCGTYTQKFGEHHISKTIGHPVMIGDVLDYLKELNLCMEDYSMYSREFNNIIYRWKDKRKPLEKQSDECIDYIYNLMIK